MRRRSKRTKKARARTISGKRGREKGKHSSSRSGKAKRRRGERILSFIFFHHPV